MEAGFEVIFRQPKDALTDGFKPQQYPLHGGTITTPERPSRTIVIEYRDHTWWLPLPHLRSPAEKLFLIDTHNSFAALNNYCSTMPLLDDPDAQSNPSTRSDAEQRRFELMCSRQKQAQILHESGGHRNARDTYRDLEAAPGVKGPPP
jgi:hypothetical protein